MKKRLVLLIFLGVALFLLWDYSVCANQGPIRDGFLAEKSMDVAVKVEPYMHSIIDGALEFDILGAIGSYPQSQSPSYKLMVNTPVKIQFSAEPLRNSQDPSYVLDAVYWINTEDNIFLNGRPLVLIEDGLHVLSYRIYGLVKIHEVSAQPAGDYKGMITVTVSALPSE